jgi:hypothetical protein
LAFSLSDSGVATRERSGDSSSEIAYPRVESFSAFDEYERNDRDDATDPLLGTAVNVLVVDGGETGPVVAALTGLVVLSRELRPDA